MKEQDIIAIVDCCNTIAKIVDCSPLDVLGDLQDGFLFEDYPTELQEISDRLIQSRPSGQS